LTYCKCAFASSRLQIYKTNKSKKVQINNYNLQIASVHLQVHKFATLQVCKFIKLQNLEIKN